MREWFRLVHVEIEARAAEAVRAVLEAQEAVAGKDAEAVSRVVKRNVNELCQVVCFAVLLLQKRTML